MLQTRNLRHTRWLSACFNQLRGELPLNFRLRRRNPATPAAPLLPRSLAGLQHFIQEVFESVDVAMCDDALHKYLCRCCRHRHAVSS